LCFALVDMRMMFALGTAVVVIVAGLLVFGERGRHLHRSFAAVSSEVAGDLIDVIANMWSVKAFSSRRLEHDRLRHLFVDEAVKQRTSWMYIEKARVLHDIALWIMAGGMLTWAIALWNRGEITPGDVVVVSALTFRILHGSRDLALSLVDMVQHFGFIADTLSVIGQPQTVRDSPGAARLASRRGAVKFDKVKFSYGRGSLAVRGLTLDIPAGQKVGIVGPSGAGKSTLIHLLQRLYDLDSGSIAIDGQSIADVRQDSLRAAMAVVPQEISLFHRSIMENIRFGRASATDEEVHDAARKAYCHHFIQAMPEGYQTLVGERGVKLSGGQKQRIGLARAFLKKAPIIILDEATSALDTESELEIQKSLLQFMQDRTIIAVAHRLSTVAAFDRIIVIKDGQVVEDGSAGALRNKGGEFDRLWRMQAEGLSREEIG
jgi:ATP-binding cassette subfamily B protein